MRKKRVYDGITIGIDVYDLTIEGRKVKREIIKHPGAAAILAFDEKDRIILPFSSNANIAAAPGCLIISRLTFRPSIVRSKTSTLIIFPS